MKPYFNFYYRHLVGGMGMKGIVVVKCPGYELLFLIVRRKTKIASSLQTATEGLSAF